MHVRRGCLPWVYKGVDAVDDRLGTSETQHSEALVAKLAGLEVVPWLRLWQSLREACKEKSGEKHRTICVYQVRVCEVLKEKQ